jgi:hypothetical protein
MFKPDRHFLLALTKFKRTELGALDEPYSQLSLLSGVSRLNSHRPARLQKLDPVSAYVARRSVKIQTANSVEQAYQTRVRLKRPGGT